MIWIYIKARESGKKLQEKRHIVRNIYETLKGNLVEQVG